MDSCDDTPKGWVAPFGHPRINACSRLPVAFRSVPRPSSPPGAKASTECPSLARDHIPPEFDPEASTMHRNHPQRPTTIPVTRPMSQLLRKQITLAQHTTVASEHHCHRRDAETSGQTLRWQRPETHQNLIHPDKDLPSGSPGDGASIWRHLRHRSSILEFQGQNHQCRLLSLLRDTIRSSPSLHTTEGGGGDRTRTDDPLLAKQVLSQLSYTPKSRARPMRSIGGPGRI